MAKSDKSPPEVHVGDYVQVLAQVVTLRPNEQVELKIVSPAGVPGENPTIIYAKTAGLQLTDAPTSDPNAEPDDGKLRNASGAFPPPGVPPIVGAPERKHAETPAKR